ncbi:MAG: ATP-dependent DNA helicase RecG [Bacteroidales bacterium]|jgi:ATP-dependent DNA helicase RecG|nr:ATP-dependent DNA helicase RecG [Bacteroidales bacterium]
MTREYLDTPVEFLKGVGPKRAELLRTEINVNTFGDLLSYYPFRYVDRSKIYRINEIEADLAYVQLRGTISNCRIIGEKRARRMSALLKDDTGEIELVWFQGIKWIEGTLMPNVEYIVFGKPSLFNRRYNIAHPEIERAEEFSRSITQTLQGIYSTTEKLKNRGLNNKNLVKLIKELVVQAADRIPETLSSDILDKLNLMHREEALRNIHFPEDQSKLQKAQARLKFEELFFIQLGLLHDKMIRQQKISGFVFSSVGEKVNRFYKEKLPFELTEAQKKVIREIRKDLGAGKQMNRLLQGDVGSGKTLVALMSMLIALDNGFQSCLMAPTEILANQHYHTLNRMTEGLGVRIGLLTGSTPASKRKELHAQLQSGDLHILAGTHALIEDPVMFRNLGLVVIDEQHRFGVAQRAKMWSKSDNPPHILVMTATPIPRTLAMTLYGDLDISVIDELPPGRKPVKTMLYSDAARLRIFGFMKQKIMEGCQVYVVYPLIKESESLDLKHLMDGYESIVRDFPLPEYAVSIVHGKMKPSDKDYEMQRFINKQTQIMVSTTVIEVGVDVPNASVMVIENAERFGLSQLHQLRGRVGRGAVQSYCLLMTGEKVTHEARKRLETMVETNDGFKIAEVDLQLRGPGDLQGTRQSGVLDLKIADLIKDERILKYARSLAADILHDDPSLGHEKNRPLAMQMARMKKDFINWSLIS